MLVHGSWFLEKTVTWWGEDLAAALHRHWTAIDRMNDYGLINNDGYVMTCWGYGMGRTVHCINQWLAYVQGIYILIDMDKVQIK